MTHSRDSYYAQPFSAAEAKKLKKIQVKTLKPGMVVAGMPGNKYPKPKTIASITKTSGGMYSVKGTDGSYGDLNGNDEFYLA